MKETGTRDRQESGPGEGMILVSACLAGRKVRYQGDAAPNREVMELVSTGRAVPVCPEQLGGLPIPRPPQEIQGGGGEDVLQGRARVVNAQGQDVTRYFLLGAQRTLQIAKENKVSTAILKSRSPSCGCGLIYSGRFDGKLVQGDGVTAALLKREGITVICRDGDLEE